MSEYLRGDIDANGNSVINEVWQRADTDDVPFLAGEEDLEPSAFAEEEDDGDDGDGSDAGGSDDDGDYEVLNADIEEADEKELGHGAAGTL